MPDGDTQGAGAPTGDAVAPSGAGEPDAEVAGTKHPAEPPMVFPDPEAGTLGGHGDEATTY